MLVLDRQAFRKMNRLLEEELTNAALNRMLRTERNSPARLEQIVAKYLMIKILAIVEFNNQESYSLCYCKKVSAGAPHFYSDGFYACEVCQMCTDYCPEIKFDNNFKSFLKIMKDILTRWDKIAQNTDSNKILRDLKLKHYFTYYRLNEEEHWDGIIDEHTLFI